MNNLDSSIKNTVICGDATEELEEFADESFRLAVTSPPYNIGKDYGENINDRIPLNEWEEMMEKVLEETFRLLRPDGKFVVNVGASFTRTDNAGRYARIPLNHYVIKYALEAGFDLYDEFVWTKNQFSSHGGGALFGSYPYPTNFMANQQHEYILVFRKWVSDEYHSQRDLPEAGSEKKEKSKITKEEWNTYTKSVWDDIPPVKSSSNEIDHDAPYPVEIPRRLIKMYSFVGDTVLDPFMGSGTTGVACMQEERDYVGIELNEENVRICNDRLSVDPDCKNQEKRQRAMKAYSDAADEEQTQTTLDSVVDDE